MKPKRCRGAAAVFASGVCAGTIASSSGRAIVAPTLLRMNVRRDTCFLVRYIAASPCPQSTTEDTEDGRSHGFSRWFSAPSVLIRLRRLHLERHAVDDAEDQRREAVVAARRGLDDRANDRHVRILEAAAERIRQQHLGGRARELVGPVDDRLAQPGLAADLGAVP